MTLFDEGDQCAGCAAAVVWAVDADGSRIAMEAERSRAGQFVLSHRRVGGLPVTVHQTFAEREKLRAQAATRGEELRLFVRHTCAGERAA